MFKLERAGTSLPLPIIYNSRPPSFVEMAREIGHLSTFIFGTISKIMYVLGLNYSLLAVDFLNTIKQLV